MFCYFQALGKTQAASVAKTQRPSADDARPSNAAAAALFPHGDSALNARLVSQTNNANVYLRNTTDLFQSRIVQERLKQPYAQRNIQMAPKMVRNAKAQVLRHHPTARERRAALLGSLVYHEGTPGRNSEVKQQRPPLTAAKHIRMLPRRRQKIRHAKPTQPRARDAVPRPRSRRGTNRPARRNFARRVCKFYVLDVRSRSRFVLSRSM